MFRMGIVWSMVLLISCGGDDKKTTGDPDAFSYESFSQKFRTATPPFQVSDTSLSKKDTGFLKILPEEVVNDSAAKKLMGGKPRYIPLTRFENKADEYYLVRAVSGSRRAAILWVFHDQKFVTSFPLLVPDANPQTAQVSSLDRNFLVNKMVTKKLPDALSAEGKDVYAFDLESRKFSLIMTDPLDDGNLEVINPIDTLSRKHTLAGDYTKDKRNFVSVRDAGTNKELNIFIHFEKNKGECKGEIKGTAILTSSRTAVFSQSGCIVELHFSSNRVTIKETGACGNYRDVQCLFEGSYSRKREASRKTPKSKTSAS